MPFTAPSAANKGNLFRIGPGATIMVAVQELVVFNVLQDVWMLIPVWSLQSAAVQDPGNGFSGHGIKASRQSGAASPLLPEQAGAWRTELAAVKRVLDSVYRAEESLILCPARGSPVRVASCRIKNTASKGQLVPLPSGGQALAVALYSYEVEVIYIDAGGHIAATDIKSGPRRQQALVYPGAGYLAAEVKVDYLGAVINTGLKQNSPPGVADTPISPGYNPRVERRGIRVWVDSYSIKG